ncbi:MAG: hypothetical protein HC847_29440 [Hydrococcus sp. RU_2_2]|nr:hypothetical protein [Hydrococcus sp. RU_2_2]
MLNPLQTVTLLAFLIALVELDSPLPTALQHEIHKVGEMLANAQNNALDHLIELAKSDCLKESYDNARIKIQRLNKSQELSRFDKPNKQNELPIPEDHIINIARAIPLDRLIKIAIAIFQAPDSSAEAKKYKSEIILKNS